MNETKEDLVDDAGGGYKSCFARSVAVNSQRRCRRAEEDGAKVEAFAAPQVDVGEVAKVRLCFVFVEPALHSRCQSSNVNF